MSKTADFDGDDILFYPSIDVVYSKIRSLAQELAVLGKIDHASQITDLLLSQNRTDHGFSLMRHMNFAFEQTGDWPAIIPASARSKSALDELEGKPSDPMTKKRYDELIGETKSSKQDPALCLAIAVALCEKAGKTDVEDMQQDDRVTKALNQIAERFHVHINALASHRKIWPLLATGLLAQHLGVDDAKFTETADLALETVRTRMEKGRQKSEHADKPIKDLLDILAANTRKNAGPIYEELDEEPPETYLHSPATHKDIEALEQRLNVSLPSDYKEFLLASNGLEPIYDGTHLSTPLFRTKDVITSTDLPITDPNLPIELITDSTGTARLIREYGESIWPRPTRYIEIGRDVEPVFLLLCPSDVTKTVSAYQKALESDKVSDVMKAETARAIADLYGSMEEFGGLEWAVIYTISLDPIIPVGTFRGWLEEVVRRSGKAYEDGGGGTCLAYECRAKRARRR